MKEVMLNALVALMNDATLYRTGYTVENWRPEVADDRKKNDKTRSAFAHKTISFHHQDTEQGKLLLDGHWIKTDNIITISIEADCNKENWFFAVVHMRSGAVYEIGTWR